ncbi:hypothetical protein [Tenacibaculum sp.]|uniref:hypothetical protein n=1 Tax=Tenacibaculum sp. TaxID=1906242 RepID=UPI003D14A0C6
MAINRFSRGPIAADVQSQFIPLPLDLIDRQIQRKQSAYDKAKATIGASQEAVYGVQGLSQDVETLQGLSKDYESKIDKAISEAGDDYSKLTAFSDELATQVTRDMRSGHLGAIQNNFIKAQNHMEDLKKRYSDGDISKAGYELGLNSISSFGGTVEDGKGGYTKASLYNPTKYLELGKTSDEYGSKIADQYAADGERYIDVKKATDQIARNLWNNPQVLDNLHEQVQATYGEQVKRGTPEYSAVFNSQLNKIAKASADKIAFRQIFKEEGIDKNTNDLITSFDVFDLIGAKPAGVKFSTSEGDFDKILTDAMDKGTHTIFQKLQEGWPKAGLTGGSAGMPFMTKTSSEAIKKAEDISNRLRDENLVKNDKSLRKAVDEIAKSDLAKDLAALNNIKLDPETITIGELKSLVDSYNTANNSSLATRTVKMNKGKQHIENFNQTISEGTFIKKPIVNVVTGKPLSETQKIALYNYINDKETKGVGTGFGYMGTIVEGTGQGYGPGTEFFTTYEVDEDGEIDTEKRPVYAIESPQVSINIKDDWFIDRLNAAKNNNVTSFRYGKDRVVLRKDPKDNGVFMYINGDKVTQKQYLGTGSEAPIKFK